MSVENWRPVVGMAGYEVSDLGRIRSFRIHGGPRSGQVGDVARIKATRPGSNGYLTVALQKATGASQAYVVHSLVAEAFLGPRPAGMQVGHVDGNRLNARVDNLRWVTPVENAADKHRHGTTSRGEQDGNAKLTEAQVRRVIQRCGRGERQSDVAAMFGISQSQVSNIVRRAAWSHLDVSEVAG